LSPIGSSWQPKHLPPVHQFPTCEQCGSTGIIAYDWQRGDTYCDCELGQFEAARERRMDEAQRATLQANLQEATIKRLASFSKLHLVSDQPPTFETLRETEALPKVRAFGEAWNGIRSLILMGPVGTGKTQLLLALVNEVMPILLKKKRTVRLVTVPDFLKELRAGFDQERNQMKDSYAALIETYRTCGLLDLDDLGAEKLTEWAKEQFYLLFDYRYRQQLPIFATSNYPFGELAKRLEERVTDRIRETFDMILVEGENQRGQQITQRKGGQG